MREISLRTDKSVNHQIRMLEKKLRKLTKKFEKISGKGCKLDVARILRIGASVERKLTLLRHFRNKKINWLGARRVG